MEKIKIANENKIALKELNEKVNDLVNDVFCDIYKEINDLGVFTHSSGWFEVYSHDIETNVSALGWHKEFNNRGFSARVRIKVDFCCEKWYYHLDVRPNYLSGMNGFNSEITKSTKMCFETIEELMECIDGIQKQTIITTFEHDEIIVPSRYIKSDFIRDFEALNQLEYAKRYSTLRVRQHSVINLKFLGEK